MNRSDAVRCARIAVALLCDVSVAASAGLADTVARVAAAVRHNLAAPAAAGRFPAGMPAVIAEAMGWASAMSAGAEQASGQQQPDGDGPDVEAGFDAPGEDLSPRWVPMLARELTPGATARINHRDYAVVTVRHEEEETCHDGPVKVVHLHLRDLDTGEEGMLPVAPTLGLLGRPCVPDDLSAFGGAGDDSGTA